MGSTFAPRSTARMVLAGLGALVLAGGPTAHAQRHSMGSAPPTAPPARFATPVPALPASAPAVVPVSSGLGPIQFYPANASVSAPQSLTRQLASDDERTRSGALSSLGAPAQYLGKGRVPYAHSVQLDLVQLGEGDQIDALLTVELDQHIVTAVLAPEGDNWRRVATLLFPTPFSNGSTTPATFVRPLRSWLQPDRYRAVFHASVNDLAGDFTENEADLNVVNNRAVVVLDFVSGARQCDTAGQLHVTHPGCELIQRWLEPDPTDPTRRFTLITGMGHISAHETSDPLSRSRTFRLTHLRSFTCQPFVFSPTALHFEPTAASEPCGVRDTTRPEHALEKPEHPVDKPTAEKPEHPLDHP